MIETSEFYDYLTGNGLDFFAGVPDSLLKNFCACVRDKTDSAHNIITANEGNAVAMAAGYHVATRKFGVVYMQNSGIGNAVNPLLSLADEEVYSIPMLLIVGWRGEPGVHDEPQHVKQGKVTLELFETMGIETVILTEDYQEQIEYCLRFMKEEDRPIALIVRKGMFSEYKTSRRDEKFSLTREKALETIIGQLADDDFIVSTTGKTSREVFEIRERNGQGHEHDFLTVGSMGHTASIALGMSLGTDKNVYCIDGDGSFLMHMGGFAIMPKVARGNLKYIMINNGAHESVGGQPTVGFDIDVRGILEGCGFAQIYEASDERKIVEALKKMKKSERLSALIVNTRMGAREDLGRPTIAPVDNKRNMMKEF